MGWLDRVYRFLNPEAEPEGVHAATDAWRQQLPTLWLLGKTGAGKSTLVQALTGNSRVEIGLGFQPCTRSASHYDFPEQQPLLRFLDTRGLAEADYEAADDLAALMGSSHALLVVMNTGEADQQVVLDAVKAIHASGRFQQLLLVHTCSHQFDEAERLTVQRWQQQQVAAVWPLPLSSVAVDLQPEADRYEGFDELVEALSEMLPMVAMVVQQQQQGSAEEQCFLQHRREILWYAGSAGTVDALPVVGALAVPALQGRMLYRLAAQYGVEWNRARLLEFVATLGTGFGMQYLGGLGARQLGKLVPVYGQTLGAATAAALSFASTFAMGRVACYYFYQRQQGLPVNDASMQALYRQAFQSIRKVAEHENTPKS